MLRPAQLPRVLTSAQARGLGLSRSQVRTALSRGYWNPLARGVFLTRPDPPTRADWAMVGVALAGPGSALSGWDAVRAHGLATAEQLRGRVLVLSLRGGCRDIGGVHVREVSGPLGFSVVSALDDQLPLVPVVAAARAVRDAALTCDSLSTVRALVARAVQRDRTTVAELSFELERAARRGSAHLRRALADLADGARSAAEARALDHLRTVPIPPFELNVPIVSRGRVIAVADILWRELRAILEIDSKEFHFYGRDWLNTMRRHNRLAALGFSLTHYAPSEIGAQSGWLDEVIAWLARRARELAVGPPPAGGLVVPDGGAVRPFVVDQPRPALPR